MNHKHCPFCGDKTPICQINTGGGIYIECGNCQAIVGYFKTEQEAWTAWDKRIGCVNCESFGIAIASAAAIKSGIIDGTQSLTGSQLIQLCDDMARVLTGGGDMTLPSNIQRL